MKLHLKLIALLLALLTLVSVYGCAVADIIDDLEDLEDALNQGTASTTVPENDETTKSPEVTTDVLTDAATEEVTTEETTTAEITTQPAPDTTEVTVTPPAPEVYDVNGFLMDDIPNGYNYKGEKITILAWEDCERLEFDIEEYWLSGEIVEQCIFDRNRNVEKRLGINLEFIYTCGDADYVNKWVQYIQSSVSVNAREFDIIAGYSLSMAACAANGLLFDMLDTDCEYLNFNKPWWSNLLLEQATIGDKLYYASGDISRNALDVMYICYANTDILNRYGLKNPQELVSGGEWTYAKFFEMCQGVYEDDGNGYKDCSKDGGDTFGYITSGIHVDPWFYGSGALICEKDSNGKIACSASFTGERVTNTVNMLNEFLDSQYGIYTSNVTHQLAFGQGRALFMIDRARVSDNINANYSDIRFVILPCPKYDTEQTDYITVLGNPFTLYSIAKDIADPYLAGLFIECFASEGYRTVSPAVYETMTRDRYRRSELSTAVYDIVRTNITYDTGRLFSQELIGQTAFRDAIKNRTAWSSVGSRHANSLKNKLVALNNIMNP